MRAIRGPTQLSCSTRRLALQAEERVLVAAMCEHAATLKDVKLPSKQLSGLKACKVE